MAWLRNIFAVVVLASIVQPAFAARITLYNADSAHPFNVLHHTLFVRVGHDGVEYGADRLDPLLWKKSRFLLEGESLRNATQALASVASLPESEFTKLSLRQRAILQRDLWSVFDSLVERGEAYFHWRILELLSNVIKRVALSEREFSQLSRDVRYGNQNLSLSLRKDGFIELASTHNYPVAASHAGFFGGRSTFLIFMKTEGGAGGAYGYLQRILNFPNPLVPRSANDKHPPLNPNLPTPAVGTEFLIFRLANLILKDGTMVGSPIVELFSMMKSTESEDGVFFDRFGRSVLMRDRFFSSNGNGLRGVPKTETDFVQFPAAEDDPFENRKAWGQVGVIQDCARCHTQMGNLKFPGIHGVQAYARDFVSRIPTKRVDPLVPAGNVSQFELTRAWKEKQKDFQILMEIGKRDN